MLLEDVHPHDRVRLTIMSEGLNHEIWLPFMTPAQLTADRIMFEVERVLQSNKEWLFQGIINVHFIHAPLPVGGGRRKMMGQLEVYLKKKRCIIAIPDAKDNMCCAKAIVTAKARLDKHPRYHSIRHGYPLQTHLALQLHRQARVPMGVLCGKPEWDKFQEALGPEYVLIVASRDFFNAVVYKSQSQGAKQVILYHAKQHFSVITSMTGFMERNYYCTTCCKGYNNPGSHKCQIK